MKMVRYKVKENTRLNEPGPFSSAPLVRHTDDGDHQRIRVAHMQVGTVAQRQPASRGNTHLDMPTQRTGGGFELIEA